MIENFSTKGLTRNPIGIIALFISMIYGFACLVLSTSLENLCNDKERLPLIWFIIIFPVVILSAFIYLVVNHHEKLYSPSDFRGDDTFIKALDKNRIREKQLSEVQVLEKSPEKNIENNSDKVKSVEETVSTETIQENESPIVEDTSETLLNKYSNAEKWAVKELSLKHNLPFKTNLSLQTKYGELELDAMGNDSKKLYVAEIKYWKSNKSDKALKLSLQEFLRNSKKLEMLYGTNREFKLIIVLIFDSLTDIDKSDIENFIKNIYENTEVEFYEYDTLKSQYS